MPRLLILVVLMAFPSVEVGMMRARAVEALKKDGLRMCDTTSLAKPEPLLGGAMSGLVACRACPCERAKASVIVWLNGDGRVCSVAMATH